MFSFESAKMTLYNLERFPKFSHLFHNPIVATFTQEALKVYTELPINYECIRSREQWDNPDQTNPLLEGIKQSQNGYWIIAQNNPDWLNYPLMYFDTPVGGKADELCPTIMEYLKSIKNVRIAGFSLFKKNGCIPPHTDSTGRSNDALACHVCLVGTGELTLQDEIVEQTSGKIYVFDSEIIHSVRNTGDDIRIILYIDFVYSQHVCEPMQATVRTNSKKKSSPDPIWFRWVQSMLQYMRWTQEEKLDSISSPPHSTKSPHSE